MTLDDLVTCECGMDVAIPCVQGGRHWIECVFCYRHTGQYATGKEAAAAWNNGERRRAGANLPCTMCGCLGNGDCGHEMLGNDCTLIEPDLICPCCYINPNHWKWRDDPAQGKLFSENAREA